MILISYGAVQEEDCLICRRTGQDDLASWGSPPKWTTYNSELDVNRRPVIDPKPPVVNSPPVDSSGPPGVDTASLLDTTPPTVCFPILGFPPSGGPQFERNPDYEEPTVEAKIAKLRNSHLFKRGSAYGNLYRLFGEFDKRLDKSSQRYKNLLRHLNAYIILLDFYDKVQEQITWIQKTPAYDQHKKEYDKLIGYIEEKHPRSNTMISLGIADGQNDGVCYLSGAYRRKP
ncbi:hypothetical protein C8R42DRAFT_384896 [Lentinula raphanica]|nr:hypothetical protein C8R42DRAFT_384896 [Lentinula raphanica]